MPIKFEIARVMYFRRHFRPSLILTQMQLVAVLVLCVLAAFAAAQNIPTPDVRWFEQTVDHFNWQTQPQKWQQRYLVVDTWYKPGGPIMFYTGNEGPIMSFYNNTGFMFDIAPEFNGLVVFGEHRYYGASLPFGDNSFERDNLAYLTVEQALADYSLLLLDLRAKYDNAPVICFGGSYGGFLAAFMRIKYPHIVDMSLAASAPIRTASMQMPPTTFFATVTNTFSLANPACPDLMRAGFTALLKAASEGEKGLALLTEKFSLCHPLQPSHVEHLVLWAVNAFTTLAMCDYPYPANFLAPLPGYPVTYACTAALEAEDPLSALAIVAGLPYNGTSGDLTCFDIKSEFIECADQSGCGTGPSGIAWDYQACSELTWEMDSNNVTDVFPPRNWTFQDLNEYCNKTFGIVPRPSYLLDEYGSGNISTSATKIIFSNGLLDPWHTGGFLTSLAPTLPAVIIADGAHHLDLRGSNPEDPESVIVARQQEVAYLKSWLAEL